MLRSQLRLHGRLGGRFRSSTGDREGVGRTGDGLALGKGWGRHDGVSDGIDYKPSVCGGNARDDDFYSSFRLRAKVFTEKIQ